MSHIEVDSVIGDPVASLLKRNAVKNSAHGSVKSRIKQIENMRTMRATAAKQNKKFSTIAPSAEAVVGVALIEYAGAKQKGTAQVEAEGHNTSSV